MADSVGPVTETCRAAPCTNLDGVVVPGVKPVNVSLEIRPRLLHARSVVRIFYKRSSPASFQDRPISRCPCQSPRRPEGLESGLVIWKTVRYDIWHLTSGPMTYVVSLWLTPTTRKRLDGRLRKNPVRKFGLIAHALARRGKEARSKRLVPPVGKPRNIAQNSRDLFL